MADNVTGIVLDIPPTVLQNIKNSDKAIKDLEQTSKKAAQNIKKDFDTIMVSGVEAFIKKVQEAQTKLGGLKMPTIDATGLSSTIQALSQAMATIDKSATTGSNRLTRIANAMTALQTANPDPQVFQNIANGISSIGNTSQQTIDKVKTLGQVMAQLARDIRTVQAAQAAQSANTATAAQYNKLYKEQAQLIRDIQTIQSKKSPTAHEIDLLDRMGKRYSEIAAQVDKLDRKQQTAASNLAKLQGQLRTGMAQRISTPAGAIDYARQAKSLNDLQTAYKNLKAVMATVDPKAAAWQQMNATLGKTREQIDSVKKKMGEFKGQMQGIEGLAGQLKGAMAGVFSVAAITGFIDKVVQTRAQFELQQVALRAILQDRQEADRVFQQAQQMALQSPFSIMEMNKFIKQLAAYQIEADKLVGTTKMLADVSAGLGVDMSRLILAYGQVKSANYLRACLGKGTRVKMFDGSFKNVEDVVVGDVLMGDDEQPRHVSKLYYGEQIMYRVNYLGGSFRCNEHHILTVYDALNMRVSDVFVLDYLKEPYRYHGVKRIDGEYKTFIMKVEPDNVDTYYGFSIDGNHRFIIEDNIVTHNSEVRQFTEAGLNIAGELANYFSELQGKMISVGDVMDMITKRMVRFEDVEEVFKRVTGAGGMFYDMQKKQSESLWGQLQRIKDAASIMFNDMGKSNQGAISFVLTSIRSLIKHWRMLMPIVMTAGSAMAAAFAIQGIKIFIANMRSLGSAITSLVVKWSGVKNAAAAAAAAQRGASMATGIGVAVTAVTALTGVLVGAWQEANKLNDEFDRIAEESATEMWGLIETFRRDADAVRDNTKSYAERKEALEELQNTFRGILPDQMLEYENILKITDGYQAATEAIKVYSAEKAKQEAQETLDKEMAEKWNNFIDKVNDELAADIALNMKMPANAMKGAIANILDEIQQEVKDGMITTAEQGYNEFVKIFSQRFGQKGKNTISALENSLRVLFGLQGGTWGDEFDDLLSYTSGKMEAFEARYKQWTAGLSDADQKQYEAFKATYDERAKDLDKFYAALQAYHDLEKQGQLWDANDPAKRTELGQQAANELYASLNVLNYYQRQLAQVETSWYDVTGAIKSDMDALELFDQLQQSILGATANWIEQQVSPAVKGLAQALGMELSKVALGTVQKDIIQTARTWAKAHGLEMSAVDKLRINAESNYSSAAKAAKALSDEAQENILKIEQTTLELIKMGRTSGNVISFAQARAQAEKMWGGTVNYFKKMLGFGNDLAKQWGYIEKHTKKAKKNGAQKDIWTPRLELIKKINSEYEKLLKYYSKEEAVAKIRSSYGDAVAEAFAKTAWGDINKWTGFDDKATVKRLQDVGEKSGKGYKKKFLEAAGTIQAEIDIKIEQDNIQKAKDEIQALFDNYELTKALGSLGLNIDLTYLVGGKPTRLEDVRKELENKLSAVKATGGEQDTVKAYEDALRKVTDMERNNNIERLKNYNKYLLEATGERVQIELKAIQDVNKIREDATLDNFSKEQAIAQRRKQMQEDLTKFDFDQFKGSDVYLQTFKDLGNASKEQLQYVIDKLKELSAVNKDLSPLQVKSIAEEIKKAEDALGGQAEVSSVFTNLKESIKFIKERNRLLLQQVSVQAQLESMQEAQNTAQLKLTQLTQKRDAIENKESKEYKEANGAVEKQRIELTMISSMVTSLENKLKSITEQIDKGTKSWANFKGALSKVREYISGTNEALTSMFEGFDSMGLVSDSMRDNFESVTEILGGVEKTFDALESIDMSKPFSIITGAGKAIGGIFSTIGGVFSIGDKKKERQIQHLQKKIEALQKAYENLGKEIERAYTYNDYKMGYDQSLKNIEAHKKAVQEQIALENAKKKKDKDKIREWNDTLDELVEKERELRNQFYEDWGSYSDNSQRSAAEDFVSTWFDAYKETGDGLDVLTGKWDEFWENMLLKQAASAVVSRRLQGYIKRINAVLDTQGLSEAETSAQIKEIIDDAKGQSDLINSQLKDWFSGFGIKGGKGELALSDLQKGIQNITEPQAAAIEAYLNSMRFAVFEQNNILTRMLTAIQDQYGTNGASPMLQEVRTIRSLVANIDSRLSKVIVSKASASSSYIVKVG